MSPTEPDVVAAGAVVLRKDSVLLVHRPRYDDWSFPKGKLDRGETAPVAAVREVREETGLRIRLASPLRSQRYPSGGRMKTVHYWHGRVTGDHRVEGYAVDGEIDEVAWVPLRKATRRLTYAFDQSTLEEALATEWRTRALIVVRHTKARARKSWRKDDRLRPLLAEGKRHASRMAPLLAAYAPTRLVSSSSVRCVQTLAPYAETYGWLLEQTDALSEEDATAVTVVDLVDELLHGKESAVLCTHRPVLPTVLDTLGVETAKLAPGEMVVAHHRKGKVTAYERH